MFFNSIYFNQPLDKWNVSNVTNMTDMFYGAKNFDQSLKNWKISKEAKIDRILYQTKQSNTINKMDY